MPYQYYQEKKAEDLPSLRSCLIIVVFIALMGDFSWLSEKQSRGIVPNTPAWEACLKEYTTTVDSFQAEVEAGKMTIEAGAEYQVKVWSLRTKLGLFDTELMAQIAQETRTVFIRDWQPDANTPDWIKVKIGTEYDRQQYAGMYFDSAFPQFQETARLKYENLKPPTSAQMWAAARIIAVWMVKWYFLMTFPIFLIVLLNKREADSSIKEELILQPRRWLYACLCGPIGLASISETAAKASRFRQFRSEYRNQHPEVNQLGPAAEAAIWRQVEQPLLSFDEAIASLKSGWAVRKPTLACLFVWLLGLFSVHTLAARVAQVQELAVCCQQNQDGDYQTESGNSQWLAAITPPLLELPELGVVVEVVGTKWIGVKSEIRLATSPRGPPAAVKEQPQEIISLSLDCIAQKRG